MTKETVLVVEDEPFVGLEIKEDLERLGYLVPEVIVKGEAVLEAVRRHRPKLLIMDISLGGGLDGIEAAFRAKAEFEVPVIFLTAYSDAETLRRVALTSPDGFLLKPFSEPELAANVRLALSRVESDESLRKELRGAISLVDALDGPALIADTAGRVAHANAEAQRLLAKDGRAPGDLGRLPLTDILDIDSSASFVGTAALRSVYASASSSVAVVGRLSRADGRVYGSLVTFERMDKRERRLLEDSAAEANATLAGFLPERGSAGEGYLVSGFMNACPSGSGDLYGVFCPAEGQAAFYNFDVMGHGLVASLFAISLHEVLPVLAESGGSARRPAELVGELYRRYCKEGGLGSSFFTITYGLVDQASGDYVVARAGHTPALRLGADGSVVAHSGKGMAVGITSGASAEESTGHLARGDRLILMSDGVLDAIGGEGAPTEGFELASEFAVSLSSVALDDFVDAFKRRYRECALESGQVDDASLLVIERR